MQLDKLADIVHVGHREGKRRVTEPISDLTGNVASGELGEGGPAVDGFLGGDIGCGIGNRRNRSVSSESRAWVQIVPTNCSIHSTE